MDQKYLSSTSMKQYKKIFEQNNNTSLNPSPTLSNQTPQLQKNNQDFNTNNNVQSSYQFLDPQQHADKLHLSLSSITEHIIRLKIGDEEFDNISVQPAELYEFLPEDYINLLNKKFTRMVQLLQNEENLINELEEENDKIKASLTDKLKESEEIISQAKLEMQELIEKNTKLFEDKQNEKLDYAELEKEILSKDNIIIQLNQNLKKITEEFLQHRNKHSELQEKHDYLKDNIMELKTHTLDLEERANGLEIQIKSKEKELEDLNKHKSILQLKYKQSELRLANINASLDKRREEYDKTIKDFQKTLQKNSVNIKRINEIEKIKEQIQSQINVKNEELQHVRTINQNYEEKLAQLKPLETQLKVQKDLFYNLKAENEMLKIHLNDLGTQRSNSIQPSIEKEKKAQQKITPSMNMGHYQEMTSEEIQAEIEKIKGESAKQKELINELENKNNEKIDFINQQKSKLNDLQTEYVAKVRNLDIIKSEREESITKKSLLENQVSHLLKKFSHLSDVLNDPNINKENNENDNDSVNYYPSELPNNLDDNEIENQLKFDRYENNNYNQDKIPKPDELLVKPIIIENNDSSNEGIITRPSFNGKQSANDKKAGLSNSAGSKMKKK